MRSAASTVAQGGSPGTHAAAPVASQTRAIDRAFLWAWWLNLVAMPYYTFDSGRPQPADFAFVVTATIPGALALPDLLRRVTPVTSALVAFVGVVSVVNVAWGLVLGSSDFFVSTAFYLFNGTVFLGVVSHGLRLGDAFARTTAHATMVALLMQLGLALVMPDRALSGRLILFFNNPNQLAYFALGAATVVTIVVTTQPRLRVYSFVAVGAAGFLAYRTYSRAAAIGVAALAFIWLLRRPGVALALALPVLVIGAMSDLDMEGDRLWEVRLAQTMEGDPSEYLEDRGLERVVDHPENLLLGAGEGMHLRFHPLGLELHSSLANVVFSYGVIGLLTFALLLGRTFFASPRRAGLLLVPSLFYSLFHNGLRFRIFWLVLAVAVVAGLAAQTQSRERHEV